MTDTPEHKSCPFCGEFLKMHGGSLVHDHGTSREEACILSGWGFPMKHSMWGTDESERWNTRTAPQVKPLVWGIHHIRNDLEHGYDLMCAETPFGLLCITDHRPFVGANAGFTFSYGTSVDSEAEHFPSEFDAIAAGWTSYVMRILSALE